MLKDALKKISSLGYDLVDGLNITEEEKKILSVLLGENIDNNINNNIKENFDENKNNKEEDGAEHVADYNEADKEDYDLSNQIALSGQPLLHQFHRFCQQQTAR